MIRRRKRDAARERVQQLHYQVLIHSFLYYELDAPLLDDLTFDARGRELGGLIDEDPGRLDGLEFGYAFRDYRGGTGAFLPYKHPDVVDRAMRLLMRERELTGRELNFLDRRFRKFYDRSVLKKEETYMPTPKKAPVKKPVAKKPVKKTPVKKKPVVEENVTLSASAVGQGEPTPVEVESIPEEPKAEASKPAKKEAKKEADAKTTAHLFIFSELAIECQLDGKLNAKQAFDAIKKSPEKYLPEDQYIPDMSAVKAIVIEQG